VINVREYGSAGPWLVVLHGGPGAPGYMQPVARELGDRFRVLEPLQRGCGGEALSVARHVADLDEVIEARCGDEPFALVGHSWGAMLALAYAAAHPGRAARLVLVSCGTFDQAARAAFRANLDARMDDVLRQRIARLPQEISDPHLRLKTTLELLLPLYSHELLPPGMAIESFDARAFEESWNDMVRLQEAGVYPAAFAAIDVPVLMLHGTVDPHPGAMVRATLRQYIRHLECREWERCGHFPWLEKFARDDFYGVLRGWLGEPLKR
jgi:pimeloyl-ACP methyl ester carboxylesterase